MKETFSAYEEVPSGAGHQVKSGGLPQAPRGRLAHAQAGPAHSEVR
ncbi:hypothetical protein [Lentzea sp. NPDC092896]